MFELFVKYKTWACLPRGGNGLAYPLFYPTSPTPLLSHCRQPAFAEHHNPMPVRGTVS